MLILFLSFRMCFNLYEYQSKASRKELTYLKNRATTNQKHTVNSQNLKRREHKHKIKGNHQTTKKERKKKETQNQQGKQGLKCQYIHMYQ